MSMFLNALLWVVYCYLTFWMLYFLFFGIVGHFRKSRPVGRSWSATFLVLIPAYKEDDVIVDSVVSAVNHSYPNDMYDVVVVADSLLPETLDRLREIPVEVLEVSFDNSTKSRSINAALAAIRNDYNAVVVLDADNHMASDFLSKMATKCNRGAKAIQGHRIAKSIGSKMALLDAVSEEVNNHIFRLGHREVGLSSALAGSGMVFEYSLFKEVMAQVEAVGGFDRELELRLIEQGIRIDYVPDAYIFDEKVPTHDAFRHQRRRWFAAQYHYLGRYARSGVKALFKGHIDYADKVLQGAQVSRLLLPGLLVAFGTVAAIFALSPSWVFWAISLAGSVIALLIAIPARFYNRFLVGAMVEIPTTFVSMLLLHFTLKGANKTFIHTKHGQDDGKPESRQKAPYYN